MTNPYKDEEKGLWSRGFVLRAAVPSWSPRTGSNAAARMCEPGDVGRPGKGSCVLALALGQGNRPGPCRDLTLKHKVKVLILVSRKTVTGDPIRKNRIKPWN